MCLTVRGPQTPLGEEDYFYKVVRRYHDNGYFSVFFDLHWQLHQPAVATIQWECDAAIHYGLHGAGDLQTAKNIKHLMAWRRFRNLCILKCEAKPENFIAKGYWNYGGNIFENQYVYRKVTPIEVMS